MTAMTDRARQATPVALQWNEGKNQRDDHGDSVNNSGHGTAMAGAIDSGRGTAMAGAVDSGRGTAMAGANDVFVCCC